MIVMIRTRTTIIQRAILKAMMITIMRIMQRMTHNNNKCKRTNGGIYEINDTMANINNKKKARKSTTTSKPNVLLNKKTHTGTNTNNTHKKHNKKESNHRKTGNHQNSKNRRTIMRNRRSVTIT